jgi:hypothetical protein
MFIQTVFFLDTQVPQNCNANGIWPYPCNRKKSLCMPTMIESVNKILPIVDYFKKDFRPAAMKPLM